LKKSAELVPTFRFAGEWPKGTIYMFLAYNADDVVTAAVSEFIS
jgi:hypothetical protein